MGVSNIITFDAHECDIAAALELLDVRQRARLYRLLGAERLGDVFAYVKMCIRDSSPLWVVVDADENVVIVAWPKCSPN